MKKCLNCKKEFEKGIKPNLFKLIFGNKKELCPYCKSNNTIIKKENNFSSNLIEQRLINDFVSKNKVFNKDKIDLISQHYKGKINLLEGGEILTLEEKKKYGVNSRIKISRDLLSIFNLELIQNQNPKELLNNLFYDIRNKVLSLKNIEKMKDIGIKEVEFKNCKDERDCEWCKENGDKKFSINEDFIKLINDNCTCKYFRGRFAGVIDSMD